MPLLIAGKTPREFIHALFKKPTKRGSVQLVRYGLVAIVSFGADFGLLYFFGGILEWNYLLSTTLAFTLSATVNYYLSTKWVFSAYERREKVAEIIIFFMICSIALLLNNLFMWIFTSGLDIYFMVSKLLTVVLVFIWSFGARRVLFHGDITKRPAVAYVIKRVRALQRG